jgi:hypothetical protein
MPKPKEKKLPKHHYIPCFYLKQWTGGDGMICEFTRKWKKVKPRRTSTEGTGYVRGLYRIPGIAEDRADIIETRYMQGIDNGAADALHVLVDETKGPSALTEKLKVHWALFLHCLILRSPEYLAGIEKILQQDILEVVENFRSEYPKHRRPTDPADFEEFKAKFLANPFNTSSRRIIPQLASSEFIVQHMCSMSWNILRFDHSPNLLLTSDRPVIMTNGIGVLGGHIAIPISPRQLFVAFNDRQGYDQVRAMNAKDIITITNTKVVEQAREYVYGISDASLPFVEKRLGTQSPATPLETGVLKLAAA